jgi:phosphatidylglycerophosphate synthase
MYLAARIPGHVSPNQLTILGLVGAALAFLGLTLSHFGAAWLMLAVVGLTMNWVGDSLDGTLARLRKIERPRYGFFVDHMTDVGAQALVVLGMGLSPYLRFELSCLVLIAYLVMTIFTLIRLHVDHTLCLAYGGVGPTELRVMLIAGIALAAVLGAESVMVTPYGIVGLYNALATLFVFAGTVTIFAVAREQMRRLKAEDPAPARNLEGDFGRRSEVNAPDPVSGTPHGVPITLIGSGGKSLEIERSLSQGVWRG